MPGGGRGNEREGVRGRRSRWSPVQPATVAKVEGSGCFWFWTRLREPWQIPRPELPYRNDKKRTAPTGSGLCPLPPTHRPDLCAPPPSLLGHLPTPRHLPLAPAPRPVHARPLPIRPPPSPLTFPPLFPRPGRPPRHPPPPLPRHPTVPALQLSRLPFLPPPCPPW